MYKISVIIPFYHGNKYTKGLKQCLERAINKFGEKIEVILVNDSPEEDICEEIIQSNMYDLKIVKNKKNMGIHQTRVNGLKEANGIYILFLDQDDILKENFFVDMISAFGNDDTIAFTYSNGLFEDPIGRTKLILNSYGKVIAAGQYKAYLKVGNLLASPGQCLIKKSCIPPIWKENIMYSNCADDYLLWILLLKKFRAKYVNDVLYEHVNTGENTSSNRLTGCKSDLEMYEILDKNEMLSKNENKAFRRRCVTNYLKENGEVYKVHDLIILRLTEKCERLKMKTIGIAFWLRGYRVCGF